MKNNIQIHQIDETEVSLASEISGVPVCDYIHEFYNSDRPASILCGAYTDQKILGIEGYIGYEVFIHGKLCQSHRSERSLVSPELRGKGVFKQLIDKCSEIAKESKSELCWGSTPVVKAFKAAGFYTYTGFRSYHVIPVNRTKLFSPAFWVEHVFKRRSPLTLCKKVTRKDLHTLKEIMALLSCVTAIKRESYEVKAVNNDHPIKFEALPRAPRDIDNIHKAMPHMAESIFIAHTPSLYRWINAKADQLGDRMFMLNGYHGDDPVVNLSILIRKDSVVAEVIDFSFVNWVVFDRALDELIKHLRYESIVGIFFALNIENDTQRELLTRIRFRGGITKAGIGNWVVKEGDCNDRPLYSDLRRWYLTDIWTYM